MSDKKVGYGKPPKETQFKPGHSGNKKGRPKGSKNTLTLLNELLNKQVSITENGRTLKSTKKAVMLTQLINKGVKGETKAIATLLPYILSADMKEEEKDAIKKALNSDDQEIIERALKRRSKEKGEEHA